MRTNSYRGRTLSIILLILICCVLVLLAGCGRPEAAGGRGAPGGAAPEEAQPLAVEALRVTRGQFVTAISASGTIAGIREALVVSETQGIVERVDFELGEEVEAGQVLLEVDDEIAALNMQQAEEQLENARIDYQTTENLVEKGGAARADLLRTRSALRGAEARFKQARKVFLDCAIKTPIPGYIASKEAAASLGNYLSPGMVIARVADLSRIRMEVSVGEGVVGLIEEGATARVKVPASCEEKVFDAQVTAVAAGSSPDTGSFLVVLEWDNDCGPMLKSGMSAEAEITPAGSDSVLIIPTSALLNREGRQVVYIDQNGTAAQREVETGRRLAGRAEVLEGLEEGDIVLVSGITRLSEGEPVNSSVIGESGSWK